MAIGHVVQDCTLFGTCTCSLYILYTHVPRRLDRATREHAAAEPPREDDGASADAEDAASDTGFSLNAALLHHEAVALLNLHGQAIAVQNFRL